MRDDNGNIKMISFFFLRKRMVIFLYKGVY